MKRTGLRALGLAAVTVAGAALAQLAPQPINVGARVVGQTHELTLQARNADCPQALDFRFDFHNSSWLRPRGGTIVRGVTQGASLPLPAVIDLTNAPPGRLTAQVDVTCENCGFLIFQNCRVDRQTLTIAVDAVAPQQTATPSPSPPTQATTQPPPRPNQTTQVSLDPNAEARLSGAQRTAFNRARDAAARAAAAADAARRAADEATRRKRGCEEELAALDAAAAAADAAAATAAQQAAAAQSALDANAAAAAAAEADVRRRQDQVQIQQNYLALILPQDGPNSQRVRNAQGYVRDAEAALAAAQANLAAARNAMAGLQAAAQSAAAAAQAAQAAAANAHAAADAKRRECLGLGQAQQAAEGAAGAAAGAASDAQRAADAAEETARGQARAALDKQIEDCETRCRRCWEEVAALRKAQFEAMRALSALGLVDYRQPGVVQQVGVWDQIGEGLSTAASEAAGALVSDLGGGMMLDVMEAAYGILRIRQNMFAPLGSTAASAHMEDSQRLSWLQQQGFANSPTTAQAVLNEMASFMSHGHSMNDMNARLQRKIDECRRCEGELASLRAQRAAGN